MRWWDISKGKLVRPKSPSFEYWGVCRIVERSHGGVLLVEEVNHQPSNKIPQEGAVVRHFIDPRRLVAIDPLIGEKDACKAVKDFSKGSTGN